jgi:hypothetical protein
LWFRRESIPPCTASGREVSTCANDWLCIRWGITLAFAAAADAQDFGVLESAETINRGNVKLGVFPLFLFPDGGDTDFRLPISLGLGVTDSVDIEGRAAFSDDVTFVGGDAEYWFLKNAPLDLSFRGGLDWGFVDGDIGDTFGVDVSLLGSAPLPRRLEVIGALDVRLQFDGRRRRSGRLHDGPPGTWHRGGDH